MVRGEAYMERIFPEVQLKPQQVMLRIMPSRNSFWLDAVFSVMRVLIFGGRKIGREIVPGVDLGGVIYSGLTLLSWERFLGRKI